jgi:hypothetical protein
MLLQLPPLSLSACINDIWASVSLFHSAGVIPALISTLSLSLSVGLSALTPDPLRRLRSVFIALLFRSVLMSAPCPARDAHNRGSMRGHVPW